MPRAVGVDRETAVKENTSPQEILNRKEIQTPLNNADLPVNEKYDAMHQQLRLWRYPVLTDLQKQVYRAIDQLPPRRQNQIAHAGKFRERSIQNRVEFFQPEELTAQVEQLFRVTDSEALDELIRIFKERSTSAGN